MGGAGNALFKRETKLDDPLVGDGLRLAHHLGDCFFPRLLVEFARRHKGVTLNLAAHNRGDCWDNWRTT